MIKHSINANQEGIDVVNQLIEPPIPLSDNGKCCKRLHRHLTDTSNHIYSLLLPIKNTNTDDIEKQFNISDYCLFHIVRDNERSYSPDGCALVIKHDKHVYGIIYPHQGLLYPHIPISSSIKSTDIAHKICCTLTDNI